MSNCTPTARAFKALLQSNASTLFSNFRVSLRTGTDVLRSYPKLVLDGASNGFVHTGDAVGRNGTIGGGKPPLCRAVHLALGVAVLGSLMGGVQLFGMIKMLGLQKADMSSQQNEWAWYGYQVGTLIAQTFIKNVYHNRVVLSYAVFHEGIGTGPVHTFGSYCHHAIEVRSSARTGECPTQFEYILPLRINTTCFHHSSS